MVSDRRRLNAVEIANNRTASIIRRQRAMKMPEISIPDARRFIMNKNVILPVKLRRYETPPRYAPRSRKLTIVLSPSLSVRKNNDNLR